MNKRDDVLPYLTRVGSKVAEFAHMTGTHAGRVRKEP
jgi:hypothetical protein